MEKDEIMLLLEKYWKAETTIAEEKAIKEYLTKHGIGSDIEEGDWFKAINEAQRVQPNVNRPSGPIKIAKHILFKVAAGVIVISGICIGGLKYYYHAKAEEEMAIRQQIKRDLVSIADALNQGYNDLNESEQVLLNIKK
jgi:hypothetical protein